MSSKKECKQVNDFTIFTKQSCITKTLRFGLKPVGKTAEYFEKREYGKAAIRKDQAYQEVKTVLDSLFKKIIEDGLKNCPNLDWENYEERVSEYQKARLEYQTARKMSESSQAEADKKKVDEKKAKADKKEEEMLTQAKTLREAIAKAFENDADYQRCFDDKARAKLFKTFLPKYAESIGASAEQKQAVQELRLFKTYFTNYLTIRQNIYSSDEKMNTIPYRIVNENFPIFLENQKKIALIQERYSEAINYIQKDSEFIRDLQAPAEVFSTINYQQCMSQSGIQNYNKIIGQINAAMNQYMQQDTGKEKPKGNQLKLRPLNKQILSDRERPTWLPQEFAEGQEGEEQMYSAIREYEKNLETEKILERFRTLFGEISVESQNIYVAANEISQISIGMKLGWDGLDTVRREDMPAGWSDKQQEKELKKNLSLAELQKYSTRCIQDNSKALTLGEYIKEEIDSAEDCTGKGEAFWNLCTERKKNERALNQNEELIEALKDYLESYQKIMRFAKAFQVKNETEVDGTFYEELDQIVEILAGVTPLYDQVRNYVTRKPYSQDKIRIMFESSSFLSGWGQGENAFDTKGASIFQWGNQYYIGVVEEKYSPRDVAYLQENIQGSNQAIWFEYHSQNLDYKNIPRWFIHSKGKNRAPAVDKYQLPIEDILESYDQGKYKKEYKKVNEEEYYDSLKKLIDYFKLGLERHESTRDCKWYWKSSEEYEELNEFYADVIKSRFYMDKIKINFDHLKEQVDAGKIYLFRLVSKDFKVGSTGTPNVQTMYWRELFSDKNREQGIMRLSANASIYMREASLKEPYFHEKGSILINKWFEEGEEWKPIPDEIYTQLQKMVQGRSMEEVESLDFSTLKHGTLEGRELEEWRQYWKDAWEKGMIKRKIAKRRITKDARFARRTYMLHAPIEINYSQPDLKLKDLNNRVRKYLKDNPNVNIIGIDRGERNLLYITVINQQGEILEQRSLNLVQQGNRKLDYHAKLDAVEKQRAEARKSWKQIGKIKDLKEGYLSQAVHEVVLLMLQYHAIIVMEDLNVRFMQSRMKVEKSVYQKFEKMLLDKLSYLAFKTETQDASSEYDPYAVGHVMNGYQLAKSVAKYKDMKMQNGVVFFVRANYTSVIDPVTGFADVFQKNDWNKSEIGRDVLKRFKDISWQEWKPGKESFIFTFCYQDGFACRVKDYQGHAEWRLVADVERIKTTKSDGKYISKDMNPNECLQNLLEERQIMFRDRHNLVDDIDRLDDQTIREMMGCLKMILQLRNSKTEKDSRTGKKTVLDYILSPALCNGELFDSEEERKKLKPARPIDADANGAYHIALKGLLYLQRINQYANAEGEMTASKLEKLKIGDKDWLSYAQTRKEVACTMKSR